MPCVASHTSMARPETGRGGEKLYRPEPAASPRVRIDPTNPGFHLMATRPAWKGYLKLSLVTCAVELSNAITHSEKVSFRVLNRTTGNRVNRVYIDAETTKPLKDDQEIKGYETEKDRFLRIEEDEIDAVQIESSHTLAIDTFVKKADIEPVYLETPYYLAPADKVSEEAFAVIHAALEKKKMAGLAKIVLFRRERPVVIEPFGKGMLLTTLRYDATVRKPETILGEVDTGKTDPELLKMATKFIDGHMTKFDPKTFVDKYEADLLKLIKAKKAGRKPKITKAEAEPEKPSNVVNLFDALKKSLAADNDGGAKKPAAKPKAKTSKARSPK